MYVGRSLLCVDMEGLREGEARVVDMNRACRSDAAPGSSDWVSRNKGPIHSFTIHAVWLRVE